MSEKFWMVLKGTRDQYENNPAIKHLTLDEALAEAKRLCVKENKSFYVLEAVKKIQIVKPETEIVEL